MGWGCWEAAKHESGEIGWLLLAVLLLVAVLLWHLLHRGLSGVHVYVSVCFSLWVSLSLLVIVPEDMALTIRGRRCG